MDRYAYMHTCGGVAFYFKEKPEPGGKLPGSQDVELPDGKHPEPGSVRLCGTCGQIIGRLRLSCVSVVGR